MQRCSHSEGQGTLSTPGEGYGAAHVPGVQMVLLASSSDSQGEGHLQGSSFFCFTVCVIFDDFVSRGESNRGEKFR